jgi:serine/threonine protein kinase
MSMSQRPAAKREPLDGLQRSRYRKIKDINSGSYGFVQLCQDTRTNEQVAVKFIERGEKVTIHAVFIGVSIRTFPVADALDLHWKLPSQLSNACSADHKVC